MLPFTPPIGKLQFILYNSKCQKTEMLYFPNDSAESTELLEILFLNKRGTRVYFEKIMSNAWSTGRFNVHIFIYFVKTT